MVELKERSVCLTLWCTITLQAASLDFIPVRESETCIWFKPLIQLVACLLTLFIRLRVKYIREFYLPNAG